MNSARCRPYSVYKHTITWNRVKAATASLVECLEWLLNDVHSVNFTQCIRQHLVDGIQCILQVDRDSTELALRTNFWSDGNTQKRSRYRLHRMPYNEHLCSNSVGLKFKLWIALNSVTITRARTSVVNRLRCWLLTNSFCDDKSSTCTSRWRGALIFWITNYRL